MKQGNLKYKSFIIKTRIAIVLAMMVNIFTCSSSENKMQKDFYRNDKIKKPVYTYIDFNGKIISQNFDRVEDFKNGFAQVKIGNKAGIIDKTGKFVIEPKYDFIFNTKENYFFARDLNEAKHFIIHKGETIEVFDAWQSAHDKIIVKKGTKWGVVKYDGTPYISIIFDYIGYSDFSEDSIPVLSNSKIGYIDKQEKFLFEPTDKFFFPKQFSEGLAAIAVTIPGIKDNPVYCSLGYRQNRDPTKKFGYIDKTGTFIIEPKFDEAEYFINNQAWVMQNEKYGLINKKGKFIIQPELEKFYDLDSNIAIVKIGYDFKSEDSKENKRMLSGKYMFIDKISGKYLNAEGFLDIKYSYSQEENLFPVFIDRLWGYANKAGKIVIKPKYVNAETFSKNNRALVQNENNYQIIDSKGNIIVNRLPFHEINFNITDNLLRIEKNGKVGIANMNGEVLIQPKYKYIGSFVDGIAWVEL